MSSRAQAHIRLSALRHNLQRVREYVPDSRIMAAIKADAYGHGALQAAAALKDADALAVATLDEAMQLRWHGEQRAICVLGGLQSQDQMRQAAEQKLQIVLHDDSHLAMLTELDPVWELDIWFKLDTGMHRLGFQPSRVSELQALPAEHTNLTLQGWMTHLACADDLVHPLTDQQINSFARALGSIEGPRSIANSAGVVAWPASHADWVRPGIMLYGSSPVLNKPAADYGLEPVMSLRSELIAIQKLQAGDGIGYGQTWVCPEDMPVGVVGIGYGDGYPRHAVNGTPVAVGDAVVPLVGRVSMDMICVDLRAAPDARVGDVVELWGDRVSVDEVAQAAGTISYELFCRLTSRVDYIYSQN